ncbi:MAG: peptidylprolyl isomerase [Devosia sp.]
MTMFIAPGTRPGLVNLIGAALVALALLAAPGAAMAQDSSSSASSAEPVAPAKPDINSVVATVGGETITEGDLSFAAEDLGQQTLQQIPPDQLRAVLLTQMIDLKLMAQAGHAANVEATDLYKLRLQYLMDRALRRAYTKQAVSDAVTPAEIKAEYDKQMAAVPAQDEIHARHILVSSEDDAKAIKAQLDAGADFGQLAKEKSIEPGAAQSGGDLGYFTHDKMVQAFADAAFGLKVNDISQPIQTQFGWHIIQVLDRRPAARPGLDQMTQQIGQQLYVQKYRALFNQLDAAAKIDIPDATLKAQVDAQLKAAQQ